MSDGITMKEAAYGIHHTTRAPYDRAVQLVTDALREEGFGVLTEIDVKATLKKKIDVEFPRYVILGACNPSLAHKALTAEPDIGLLLPCNVIVAESPDGGARISALKPTAIFTKLVETPGVDVIARDAEARISRALAKAAKAEG